MSTEQQLDASLEDQPTEELPPAPPAPLVIPRGVQLVLLLVGLLALWVAARAARSVVEIIIVASFIALMLNPFVAFNQVFSPQYMIWLLPLAALACLDAGERRPWPSEPLWP